MTKASVASTCGLLRPPWHLNLREPPLLSSSLHVCMWAACPVPKRRTGTSWRKVTLLLSAHKRMEDDVNSSRCAFPKFVRILYICSVLLECTFYVQKLAGPAAKFTTPLTLCDPVKVWSNSTNGRGEWSFSTWQSLSISLYRHISDSRLTTPCVL